MKKFGIFACAALATLCTARLSAAVESDIVGYTTITMEAGKWYQVGCPFVALDSNATGISQIFGSGFSNGDILYVYLAQRQAYATLSWSDEKGGWCASNGNLTPFKIEPGQAIFVKKATTGDVLVNGRVDDTISTTFGSANGNTWHQVVLVYPEDTLLKDLTWTGLANGDELHIYLDQRQAYATLYWSEEKGGWCASNGNLSPYKLPKMQGLFIHKVSPGEGSVSVRN